MIAGEPSSVNRRLLDVLQELIHPTARLFSPGTKFGIAHVFRIPTAAGQRALRGFVVQKTNAKLSQVVGALRAPRRLARGLHGRQQQRDQHADDRDHDE